MLSGCAPVSCTHLIICEVFRLHIGWRFVGRTQFSICFSILFQTTGALSQYNYAASVPVLTE